jgi:hypothetical protein
VLVGKAVGLEVGENEGLELVGDFVGECVGVYEGLEVVGLALG